MSLSQFYRKSNNWTDTELILVMKKVQVYSVLAYLLYDKKSNFRESPENFQLGQWLVEENWRCLFHYISRTHYLYYIW